MKPPRVILLLFTAYTPANLRAFGGDLPCGERRLAVEASRQGPTARGQIVGTLHAKAQVVVPGRSGTRGARAGHARVACGVLVMHLLCGASLFRAFF